MQRTDDKDRARRVGGPGRRATTGAPAPGTRTTAPDHVTDPDHVTTAPDHVTTAVPGGHVTGTPDPHRDAAEIGEIKAIQLM